MDRRPPHLGGKTTTMDDGKAAVGRIVTILTAGGKVNDASEECQVRPGSFGIPTRRSQQRAISAQTSERPRPERETKLARLVRVR